MIESERRAEISKDDIREMLEAATSEKLNISYLEIDGLELFVEAIYGNGLVHIYMLIDEGQMRRGKIQLRGIMVFISDPICATIFTWFIPSFSSDVEVYFYSDWTVFYISTPSIFDLKKAVSAVRIAVSS
ncbi:MAG: hypothetical protein QW397_04400 [Fervidicoccaceae archaeon]